MRTLLSQFSWWAVCGGMRWGVLLLGVAAPGRAAPAAAGRAGSIPCWAAVLAVSADPSVGNGGGEQNRRPPWLPASACQGQRQRTCCWSRASALEGHRDPAQGVSIH